MILSLDVFGDLISDYVSRDIRALLVNQKDTQSEHNPYDLDTWPSEPEVTATPACLSVITHVKTGDPNFNLFESQKHMHIRTQTDGQKVYRYALAGGMVDKINKPTHSTVPEGHRVFVFGPQTARHDCFQHSQCSLLFTGLSQLRRF